MRRIRSHLTYANVMVTVLAFVVLAGGAAYAANTVFSGDIVNGEVKTADIGNNEVRSVDVRDETLTGGGLSGADIRESTLGKVPNANKLDGLDSSGLVQGGGRLLAARFIRLPLDSERSLLEIPGFGRIDARCELEGARINFINTTSGAIDFWIDAEGNTSHEVIQSLGGRIVAQVDELHSLEASTIALGFGDDPGARKTATVHSFVSQGGVTEPCVFQAQGMLWISE